MSKNKVLALSGLVAVVVVVGGTFEIRRSERPAVRSTLVASSRGVPTGLAANTVGPVAGASGGPIIPPVTNDPYPTTEGLVNKPLGRVWDLQAGSTSALHTAIWMAAFPPSVDRPKTKYELAIGTFDPETGATVAHAAVNAAAGEVEGTQLDTGFHGLVAAPDPETVGQTDTIGWVVGSVSSVTFSYGTTNGTARTEAWSQDPSVEFIFVPNVPTGTTFAAKALDSGGSVGSTVGATLITAVSST